MTKQSRRKFTGDFKAKVVMEALKERSTVEELAKKYDLHPTQINTWKREAAAKLANAVDSESGNKQQEQQADQLEKLYAQIGQLKVENDFLKKKIVTRPLSGRRSMVELNHPYLSIRRQCELLKLHRSGLYYVPVSETSENLEIMRILDGQYFLTPFYGERRLMALLRLKGYNINRKRIRRLMKLVNWNTLFQEPNTSKPDKSHKIYPYLLKGMAINKSNQVWCYDITYIPMKKGFMYLCAIIDVHTRYVVNWGISNTMNAEWCRDIADVAILTHGKPEIFNTDQGSQFTSEVFTELLKGHEIKISMDGKGRALDNIWIERLWRSVKYEHIYLNVHEDGLSLYQGLKGYFNFYNRTRVHQSLDYSTPIEAYMAQAA